MKIKAPDEEIELLGPRLRKLLKENKKTQNDLANYIGITKQSVSLYVTGKRTPDIDTLIKICDYLNVSADYLLGRSNLKSTDIDNKEINRRFGLSDKSIKVLEACKKSSVRKNPGLVYLINYLIEDESIIGELLGSLCENKFPDELDMSNDLRDLFGSETTGLLSNIEAYFLSGSNQSEYQNPIIDNCQDAQAKANLERLLEQSALNDIQDKLKKLKPGYLLENDL